MSLLDIARPGTKKTKFRYLSVFNWEALQVISCPSFNRLVRIVSIMVPILLGTGLLSGCVDTYPADMNYELRTDPILTSMLETTPTQFDGPGQLPYLLTNVSEKDRLKILEPSKLAEDQKRLLEETLIALFGTPLHPQVESKNEKALEELHLDEETLSKGSMLYRQHCLHCHGLTGNGRGPTAAWVNPHPRDYRPGIFKFTSTRHDTARKHGRKPRRADLLRVLREGVEGTSMPSFGLYPADQLDALASYVVHLSLRGETEKLIMTDLIGGSADPEETILDQAKTKMESLVKWWQGAENPDDVIRPDISFPAASVRKESVVKGFQLFQAKGCLACHLDFGRKPNYKNDVWGTIVNPADLTAGVYRGGRRPIDLYWRIHSGINGAQMPAPPSITSAEIWDIINFLQVLPYPEMRKEYGIDIH